MSLEGKVALVTGAGSGIGKAMASALHASGASVVLVDMSGAEAEVASDLGDRAIALNADVTEESALAAAFDAAAETFGGLDILCNNAGIDGDLAPVGEATMENFDRVMAINLRAVYLGMKLAVPSMIDRAGGSIISTSSVAGLAAQPGASAYAASKAGVIGMTRVAAVDLASHGICVNAICPGLIDTPLAAGIADTDALKGVLAMTPMGRLGNAYEIADVTVWLASEQSSFVTGQAIAVDGGYSIM